MSGSRRSPWRDADPSTFPDAPFVVRVKAPREGETVIEDAVQGTVRWKNETLDDMVLLRSDGTPTYMLAVVVDDHDMSVTHVIRGDDHLANVVKEAGDRNLLLQIVLNLLLNACDALRQAGRDAPRVALMPLIC